MNIIEKIGKTKSIQRRLFCECGGEIQFICPNTNTNYRTFMHKCSKCKKDFDFQTKYPETLETFEQCGWAEEKIIVLKDKKL